MNFDNSSGRFAPSFPRRVPTARRSVIYASILACGALSVNVAYADAALGSYAGDLIVSSATYYDPGFASGSALPISTGATTSAGSAFCTTSNCLGNVWNNDGVDANFGVTAGITLQDVNASTGTVDNTLDLTSLATAQGINLVTSFSSKSELALNVSADGSSITFMGYNTTPGQLDISNSNTPAIAELGNTDTATPTYRSVAQINLSDNALQVTTTNAYDGNNGRAAILASNGSYYMVGNAGNGSGGALTTGATGVQLLAPGANATPSVPGTANVGAYSITQNGYTADKTAKDSNYRGMTIFNNTLYVTKGSGGNGINTVYQVGTAGSLPAAGNATPVTILPGFNTTLAKAAMTPHPFGIWFANSTTLYVADEGSGASTDFGSSPTTQAGGLQKYSLVNGTWALDYTLKGSLIGQSYTVSGNGSLAGDSLTTTTDGLRNLTGQVNANGTVTLYAVTSTEGSLLGDAGADPNKLVGITDNLSFTSASQASGEDFSVVQTAALGQVIRGVALAPVPEPENYAMMMAGLGLLGVVARRRKAKQP
jgi:PEP-CTERM motif-containing protein